MLKALGGVVEIAEWLEGLGLGQYASAFAENAVRWDVLPELTTEDLKEIGVTAVGDRRRLLHAITALAGARKSDSTDSPSPPSTAPAAERRQVTVMFCDLAGSTALSARFDPEDLQEIVGAYHRAVSDTVTRFAGFVAKYMGDGVLIYFGYPQAHEDDAERGVRAALAVIGAVGKLPLAEPLQVRLGIASGLVVVGDLIGEGSAQERGIVGETPNLAARLQGLARPNTVVVAESTHRQLGTLFEVEDLGPQALAGFPEAQRAWRVIGESGIISRFEALRSGTTPLVGRDEEIELLLRRWDQAKAGEGRVALISGEPGIGKSRLTAALAQRIASELHTRLRYFCSPYHQDSVLHPFILQLERAAAFTRDDTPEEKRTKIDALLRPGAKDDEDLTLIAELMSLPNAAAELNLTPQLKRERLFEALLRQLHAVTHQNPALMVFEDAHWVDPTSRELLDLIINRVASLPVLLIVTFRPEFQQRWGGQPHVAAMALNRLGGREVAALVQGIAGNAGLANDLVDEIVERTDGVPLFIEELTKAVLEQGDHENQVTAVLSASPSPTLALPATLHASLIARLDRIGGAAKEVAQIGAVLGREFSYELIQPISQLREAELQGALTQLTEAELLFSRGSPPHATYLFKHALVQDAAYSTLLHSRRRQLHGRAGSVLNEQFPDTAGRQPEIVARHFTEAGVADLAIDYWHRAGERALQRSANAEASAHLRAGIKVIESLPPGNKLRRRELDLQMALGSATRAISGHASDQTLQVYSRARELLDAMVSVKDQISVLYGLWSVHVVRCDFSAAFDIAKQSLSVAERDQEPEALAFAHRMVGFTLWATGRFHEAVPHFRITVDLYAPGQKNTTDLRYSQDHAVWALSMLALNLWALGYPDQAASAAEQSISWATAIGHAMTTGFALSFGSVLNAFLNFNQPDDEPFPEKVVKYCTEHDLRAYTPMVTFYYGLSTVRLGETAEGLKLMLTGLAGTQKINMNMLRSMHLGHLASARAEAAEAVGSFDSLDEAFGIVERTQERVFEAELHRIHGELLIRVGRLSEAERALERALAVARAQQARMLELRAANTLAGLWLEQGKQAKARDLLAPIYGWFTEGLDSVDLKKAKALLDGTVIENAQHNESADSA